MKHLEMLEALCMKAMQTAQLHPEVEQVTAVQTSTGNIHFVLDSPLQSNFDTSAENQLIDVLKRTCDTHILMIVTVWNRQEVDIPTISLRTRLVELDIRNRDALLLLYGEHGRHARILHTTLPPSMQNYPSL